MNATTQTAVQQPPSRRQLLAAIPAAAVMAMTAADLLPKAAPQAPAEDAPGEDSDGWGANDHPCLARFLLGLWAALDAYEEAPECDCDSCHLMTCFAKSVEMYASALEGDLLPRSGFPEHVERIWRDFPRPLTPAEDRVFQQVLAQERGAALPIR